MCTSIAVKAPVSFSLIHLHEKKIIILTIIIILINKKKDKKRKNKKNFAQWYSFLRQNQVSMYVFVLRRLYNPSDVDASLYIGCRQKLMSLQSAKVKSI